jgi:hypothetical protein
MTTVLSLFLISLFAFWIEEVTGSGMP